MTALQSTGSTPTGAEPPHPTERPDMTTSGMTDDDLRALAHEHEQAARDAAAEVERRNAERAEAAAAVQRGRDARLVLAHRKIEDDLVEAGRLAEVAFTDAARRGDYGAAFVAYVAMHSTRPARQMVRDRARTAEANAQTGVPVTDTLLAYYPSNFLERLEQAAEQQASLLGQQTAERLCEQAADGEVA